MIRTVLLVKSVFVLGLFVLLSSSNVAAETGGLVSGTVTDDRTHAPVAGREEPTDLLTPAGVSYEMALAAVLRSMGEDMPAGFGLNYNNVRITPGLPGPAQT